MLPRIQKYSSIVALLLFFAAFTACEKSELDGNYPADGPTEAITYPQDMRVNDDSDQEDSGPVTNKNLDASDNTNLTQNTRSGVDLGNVVPGQGGGDDDDDMVNDDSDEEEDGRQSNNLNGSEPKAGQ